MKTRTIMLSAGAFAFTLMAGSGQASAQYAGMANASGNQPIYGAVSPPGLTGIAGDPTANPSGISAYGASPAPWYGNDSVRNRLNLNQSQYDLFTQNYWQSYQGYNNLAAYQSNLTPKEWMQQLETLQDMYNPGPTQAFGTGTLNTQSYSNSRTPLRYDIPSSNYANWNSGFGNAYGAVGGYDPGYGYDSSYGGSYGGFNPGYGAMNLPETQDQYDQSLTQREMRHVQQQSYLQQRSRFSPISRVVVSPRFSSPLQSTVEPQNSLYGNQQQTWETQGQSAFDFPVDVYFTSQGTVAPVGE